MEDYESTNKKIQEKLVLLRHSKEKHQGKKVEYNMKIVRSFQHDPLRRQCSEANLDKKC